MKKSALLFACSLFLLLQGVQAEKSPIPSSPNGIDIPKNYQNWRIIGTSHRTDNETLRAILGNHIAIKAARSGKTNPWPDGTILAKIVWNDRSHPAFAAATIPGELVHTEFMLKDSKKFAATKGWGFARWKGVQQIPFADAAFQEDCLSCHKKVQNQDYVFTVPAQLP